MAAARRRRDQGAEEATRRVFTKARRLKKEFTGEQLNVLVAAMYYEIEHVKGTMASITDPEIRSGLKDSLEVADELYDLFAAAQGKGKTT